MEPNEAFFNFDSKQDESFAQNLQNEYDEKLDPEEMNKISEISTNTDNNNKKCNESKPINDNNSQINNN